MTKIRDFRGKDKAELRLEEVLADLQMTVMLNSCDPRKVGEFVKRHRKTIFKDIDKATSDNFKNIRIK